MEEKQLIPNLFKTEFSKIVSVLVKHYGFRHIENAEDIVSDTFMLAAENWAKNGIPDNPTGWLYGVAKNKSKDFFKRDSLFHDKIAKEIQHTSSNQYELEVDLSEENIDDSQLRMMFAICHPCISKEAQVGLSLRILCGFGIEEIANAFLSNKETINKRLLRAKQKLRDENVELELPPKDEINSRLMTVLQTLYLLFNEGYYSTSQKETIRKELCMEAMRLNLFLVENPGTDLPQSNSLLSLMCFQVSRFDARLNSNGEVILYEDQDRSLWNEDLIKRGNYYLHKSAQGKQLSKFHLEAAIAYWHCQKDTGEEKWEHILQNYNLLLQMEYSPIAALNRTYALAKSGKQKEAIVEAEKLKLNTNHFYFSLLGELYLNVDKKKAKSNFEKALSLAKTNQDQLILQKKIAAL